MLIDKLNWFDFHFDEQEYLKHIIKILSGGRNYYGDYGGIYYLLFDYLNHIQYIPSAPLDEDRIGDALSFRQNYIQQAISSVPSTVEYCMENGPSILEVLVALVQRGESYIMTGSIDNENHIPCWFMEMLKNIGLLEFTNYNFDTKEVDKCLIRFLNRQYKPNGEGGLFVLKNPGDLDLRTIDIWKQMCLWFSEVLEEKGFFI